MIIAAPFPAVLRHRGCDWGNMLKGEQPPSGKHPKQDPRGLPRRMPFRLGHPCHPKFYRSEYVVPLTGLEPVTPALRMRCSTS